MARRDDLLVEIAREESRLAALNADVEESRARLAALRNKLAAGPLVQIVIPPKSDSVMIATPMTNAAKVALFKSLFRGREDVFPRRWENAKKHKFGYSPACDNEWVLDLCEKKKGSNAGRRATCGECQNQATVEYDEELLRKREEET